MRKILIAYDGSETSREALKEVEIFITQNEEIEFLLLSISNLSNPYTNAMMQRRIRDEEVEKIERQHDIKVKNEHVRQVQNQLDDVKKEFKKKGAKMEIEVRLVEGDHNPGENICEYAETNDIDMIVVGSRGLGNIKKVFLGSVSNYVVNHSNVPVLVVK